MSAADRLALARASLRDLLDPQTDAEDDLVEWLGSTLSVPGSLETLTGMLYRQVRLALHAGGHTGRQEVLAAAAKVVVEVEGADALDEAVRAARAER